ncbi:MAG: YggS family pyridoxal phosphate-dependent enzyme [Candidatus Accumulibacter sp.]|uniref:YggS family pyridoxal phosphate-dependent enzyme n=1 Tax=Accumulibacter sp. TaxID=2053492 RepID=UPI001A106DD2|nr:YggS family pyridoxal phosphate-dependent enzyme [Accumulibacter sp.]MBE2258572.1 YggS family pyridoxal phosphate-dependent enzyme [Paracoccaceae bacterium]MCB1941089.1 YggS family pyridoxal phosphate-dependent enzyme [Accumulibacter sp.]MCP5248226.1 YggS family pyridoxal phosphate-dependent enzyme [Accumulibacter sp.]
MITLPAKLQAVLVRIARAAGQYGRDAADVKLLAVSKTWPVARIRDLAMAGQKAFGESFVQEGLDKIATLRELGLEWHFIGSLQSNKTRVVAEAFDWVHSVDRLRIAERLSEQRPASLPPLSVCLQVNVSGEASKGGVAPAQAPALALAIARLPGLCLRGLMTIPAPSDDFDEQRRPFRRLRELSEQLQADGLLLDTLSMGMSHDLEAAIAEGATLVRVGTAIFGERYTA